MPPDCANPPALPGARCRSPKVEVELGLSDAQQQDLMQEGWDLVIRSALHGIVCRVCAEACERCAQEFRRHAEGQQMARCTATCQECAAICRIARKSVV